MSDYQDLSGSRFQSADLRGSTFTDVYLNDVRIRDAILSGMRVDEAVLDDVEINGEVRNLRINGVDVAPLVSAELDRRYPQRPKMRPTTAAGFVEAWEILGRLWAGTVDRARSLPPEMLHESVDGEWSFIETLRHLSFASAAWVGRGILGDLSPWHPLDLPWDGMPDKPGIPRDREIRPDLAVVVALRNERRGDGLERDRWTDRRAPRDHDHSAAGRQLAAVRDAPALGTVARRPQRGVAAPALCRT